MAASKPEVPTSKLMIRTSILKAAVLYFWREVTSHSILNSTVGFLDPENMEVAV